MKQTAIVFAISIVLALSGEAVAQQASPAPIIPAIVKGEGYYRTELYFGRSIPGGAMVSDEAWEEFLSQVVTPLFPDGFTVLSGRGQYREATGKIAREPSHVLVFLYKKSDRKGSNVKIEQIRAEYKRRFSQESVLRVDSRKTSLVSF